MPIIDYVDGINDIEILAKNTYNQIESQDFDSLNKEEVFDKVSKFLPKKPELPVIDIVDPSGKVIISTSPDDNNSYVDIGDIIARVSTQSKEEFYDDIYTVLKTFKYEGKLVYFMYSQVPEGKIVKISNSDGIIPMILSLLVAIIIFFYLTNKKMKYLFEIMEGIEYISSGDLEYVIPELGKDELEQLANRINLMSRNLKNKIELEKLAENTKNELITNVSHDLKTPLTSIIGYISLIRDKKYDSENILNEYIEIVYNKSERLKKLIIDLFDFTKISNLGYKLELEKINIFELINQMIEEYRVQFEEKGLFLKIEIESSDKSIYGDPIKLVRIFDNLMSNSLKYSKENSTVEICAKDSEKEFIFFVINESENMDENKTNKIFDRFYKVDESRNSENYGSGIGLAITKSIVELHNGKISAYYNEGKIKVMIKLPY